MKKILISFIALTLLTGCAQTSVGSKTNTNAYTSISDPIVVKVDLSDQGLTKLPDYVMNMTSIEELDISHNNITGALQAEIHFLKNLKVLNASNNDMTGVPAEVGQLSNLITLDLSNNKLTGLPYELANLKKLQTLNLSGNAYAQQDLDVILKGLPTNVRIIK